MTCDVALWLSKIEEDNPNAVFAPTERRKRKGHAHSQRIHGVHPTPPHSPLPPQSMSSPKKKQKVHHGSSTSSHASGSSSDNPTDIQGEDDAVGDSDPGEPTPRPTRFSRVEHESLSSSHRTGSNRSGASSPRKRLADMDFFGGVVVQDFSDRSGQPPLLGELRRRLLRISKGRGVLGLSSKSSLLAPETQSLHEDFNLFAEDPDSYFSTDRDRLGHTPSPDDVLYVVESAAECAEMGFSEATWNNEVHNVLLALALRPRCPGRTYKRVVKFAACPTATLIKEYKQPNAPEKKIDYCIYLDPRYDVGDLRISQSIDAVRQRLPLLSINATADGPFLRRPIAIYIETKRPGEGWDDAALQASTWLSAHIELLSQLIARGHSSAAETDCRPKLDDIGFVPGFIIQGQEWYFVAATRSESRTVMWAKIMIGSASDVSGVYQIVACLQVLQDWILTEYWPWFQSVIHRAARATSLANIGRAHDPTG